MRSTLPAGAGLIVSKKAVREARQEVRHQPDRHGSVRVRQLERRSRRSSLKRFANYAGSNKAFVRVRSSRRSTSSRSSTTAPRRRRCARATSTSARSRPARSSRFETDARFKSISRNTLDYQFMAMNVTDPQLKDLNLRLAIRYGIDVPSIIAAAFDGKWTRANAIIPQNMGLGYWKDAPTYARDVDKAKELPGQGGPEQRHADARHRRRRGQDKIVCQVIQANLKDVGITSTLNVVDAATFNAIPGAGGGGKNRQLVYGGYVTEPDPSWSTVWFTCAQIGLWNWDNWCDKGGFDRAALRGASRRPTRPSARSSTSSCRSSGTRRRAWSGSPIRRASTPHARA